MCAGDARPQLPAGSRWLGWVGVANALAFSTATGLFKLKGHLGTADGGTCASPVATRPAVGL